MYLVERAGLGALQLDGARAGSTHSRLPPPPPPPNSGPATPLAGTTLSTAVCVYTDAGNHQGIDHNDNWLRFPYDCTFWRSHDLRCYTHLRGGQQAARRPELERDAVHLCRRGAKIDYRPRLED
jgi:hypothetical protein